MRRLAVSVRALLLAALAALLSASAAAGPAGFARATAPWPWDLPRDHRSHPEHALEWWYLTGRLVDEAGRSYGYQATFFRLALTAGEPSLKSPFAARDFIVFHGAVTDVDAQTFTFDQDGERAAVGWAGASAEALDVHVFGRRLRQEAPDRWQLAAEVGDWRLDLTHRLDGPVVLHGDRGLSQKGPEPGQASHYVSRPRLTTSGTLTRPDGRRLSVSGLSWFDQEFGSAQLSDEQVGWDWFSVRLEDGSALMVYQLRERSGGTSTASSGTFIEADGTVHHLVRDDFAIEVTDRWTSRASGATWPAGWVLRVPRLAIELTITPVLPDQEMRTGRTTAVTYWEGLCRFTGRRGDAGLAGHGHVELVGHAGAVAGLQGGARRDPP